MFKVISLLSQILFTLQEINDKLGSVIISDIRSGESKINSIYKK